MPFGVLFRGKEQSVRGAPRPVGGVGNPGPMSAGDRSVYLAIGEKIKVVYLPTGSTTRVIPIRAAPSIAGLWTIPRD